MNGIVFKNRKDAAERLALKLLKYQDKNALVLGVPRGGIEIAYHVARFLNGELSVIVSKKLPHPLYPEYGIGAISEEGFLHVNENVDVPENILQPIINNIKNEINRRVALYRKGEPLPEMTKRTVMLLDDGIATGVTLIPAIDLCRKHGAQKIIVAAPVSGKQFSEEIYRADDVIIFQQPDSFQGVGQFYEDFLQLTDQDVLSFLENNPDSYRNQRSSQ
jgi:putative phosphoribosyl transferase